MNVTLRQPMTVEQFLAWEERQPLRYKFDGLGAVGVSASESRMTPFNLT